MEQAGRQAGKQCSLQFFRLKLLSFPSWRRLMASAHGRLETSKAPCVRTRCKACCRPGPCHILLPFRFKFFLASYKTVFLAGSKSALARRRACSARAGLAQLHAWSRWSLCCMAITLNPKAQGLHLFLNLAFKPDKAQRLTPKAHLHAWSRRSLFTMQRSLHSGQPCTATATQRIHKEYTKKNTQRI